MLALGLKQRCDVDRLHSVHARHSRLAALWNMDDVRDHGHRLWITRAGLDDERDETGQGGDERVGELYRRESMFQLWRTCQVGMSGLMCVWLDVRRRSSTRHCSSMRWMARSPG
jgi:hypothetical protein